MRTIPSRLTGLLALTLLPFLAAPVSAGDPPPDEKRSDETIERRREVKVVVATDGDVERRELTWTDDSGDVVYVTGENEEPFVLPATEPRGFLGVFLMELTPELRSYFGVQPDQGVLVSKVESGTPADRAGLSAGDVIVAVGEERVDSAIDVKRSIAPRSAGERVEIRVVRNREPRTAEVELEQREPKMVDFGHLFDRDEKGRIYIVGTESEKLAKALEEAEKQAGVDLDEALRKLHDPGVKLRIERELESREDLEEKLERLEGELKRLEEKLERVEERDGP